MTLKLTIALCLALGATCGLGPASTAWADDYGDDAPELTWTGFYMGVDVGGTRPSVGYSHKDAKGLDVLQQNGTGWGMGLELGAQRQWGSLVAGLEGSFNDTVDNAVKQDSPTNTDRTRESAIRSLFAFTARLGLAHGNWMIYGKGGWANAEVDQANIQTSTQLRISEFNGRANGWTVGGGFEYALYPSVIFGTEYDWVRLNPGDRLTPSFLVPGAPAGETDTAMSADLQIAKARFVFKIDP